MKAIRQERLDALNFANEEIKIKLKDKIKNNNDFNFDKEHQEMFENDSEIIINNLDEE